MRIVTDHIVNPVNDRIKINVTDESGAGGANHRYEIIGMNEKRNASFRDDDLQGDLVVLFQNGPIGEHGVNGVTQEVLLAIVADRLRSFQAGPFACRENALALTKVEEAMQWLQKRALDRMRHGVEGQNIA